MKNLIAGLLIILSINLANAERITIDKKQSHNNKLSVISSNSTETVISIKINNFELKEIVINGEKHQIIVAKELSKAYEEGNPDVLKMAFSLQIPNNIWMNQYEIISSKYVEYQNINLAPSRRVIYRNENPSDVTYEKGSSYSEDLFYPHEQIQIGEPFIVRDYRGESVSVRPFQYNPITKTLRVYTQLDIKISSNNETGKNVLKSSNTKKINSEFEQLYKRLFVNYSSNNNRYTTLNDQGNLLIIAHNDYINQVNEFANWKRQRGIPTEIINLTDVGSNANEIKTYIENYYNTNGLTYVILVGDNTYIPSLSSNGDSDQAYAQISGDDHYPELIIGRFSVESDSDIQTITQRSIWYERDVTIQDSWLEDAIGIASSEGGASSDDGEADFEHMDNIRTDLLNYGYTTVEQDYDNNSITASTLGTHIEKGVGIINYVGHGGDTEWVSSGFNNSNVNSLNNVNKLPFIFDVACVNGNFHNQTCFAEAWTRATNNDNPTGAVAIIASTVNQPWSPPMDGQDEMIDILIESYDNNIKRTFGGIAYNGVMHMLDEYPSNSDGPLTADTWTIFGDPSLHVRTKTPMSLVETHSNTISIGETTFTVNSSVEGAFVALSKLDANNNIVILGTGTISGGSTNITIPEFDTVEEMIVTVTAYNYIPAISTVQVIAPNGPYLVYENHSINDASANNNGNADFGENILLNLSIKNVGVENSSNANLNISSSNSNISITDNSEAYGDLLVDEIKNINNAFELNISDDITDQESISFDLDITDDNGSYSGTFNIVANAPSLEIQYLSINDENGNNNGVLDAGEDVIIRIQVKNVGHASIASANLINSESSPYFSFNSSSIGVSALDALTGTQIIEVPATVEQTVPDGQSVLLDFNLVSGNYTASTSINLPIGLEIENWESDTFDTYDWENTSSSPWTIVSDVVYAGNNASKSGTIGNNETSILTIELDVINTDSISFYKKVSCEDSGSDNYWYDFLQFDINGSKKGKWDGESDWSREAYPVSEGTVTLTWTYSKDEMETSGSDCAWIDDIILPAHTTNTTTTFISKGKTIDFSIYPIPTKDNINIKYSLLVDSEVYISILNISGETVKVITDKTLPKGLYKTELNGLNLCSGVYFVNFISNNTSLTKKLIIE